MAGTAVLGLSRELRTPPIWNRRRTSRWGQVEHRPVATSSTSVDPPQRSSLTTCDLVSQHRLSMPDLRHPLPRPTVVPRLPHPLHPPGPRRPVPPLRRTHRDQRHHRTTPITSIDTKASETIPIHEAGINALIALCAPTATSCQQTRCVMPRHPSMPISPIVVAGSTWTEPCRTRNINSWSTTSAGGPHMTERCPRSSRRSADRRCGSAEAAEPLALFPFDGHPASGARMRGR